jgi:hypothetical protein
MADLSPKLPEQELAKLQTIMTMTVFKSGTCSASEFGQIPEAVLEMRKLKTNNVSKDQFSVEDLVDSIAGVDSIDARSTRDNDHRS